MRRCGSLLIVVAMFFLPATLARAQDQKQQATDVETILQETNARQLRRDFAIAEFYRRTGHPDSAFFYYKLIRKRYPNTEIAKNAAERIVELVDGGFVQDSGSTVKPPKAVEAPINDPSVSQEISKLREQVKSLENRIAALESKPSAVRIGEIIVVGNTKTPTPDILKHIALYPGEVLQYASLRIAEEKLTKLGIFVVDPQKGIRPTVSVLENEGHFRDILVKVQELALERADKSDTQKKNAFAKRDSDSIKKLDGKQGVALQSAPVNLAFREFKDHGLRTVILENSRLIIEPGTKVRLTPVKTKKGNGVRLEWSGVVVEALRMKIETSTQIIEIEGADEGTFSVRNLQKGAAKVGQITVVGNTKTPHSAICKKMQLVPGDVLDDKALRTAEKNLAAFDATIEVIDTDDPGIKDILVRVKKK